MEEKKKTNHLHSYQKVLKKWNVHAGNNSYSFKIYHSYFQGFLAALIKKK